MNIIKSDVKPASKSVLYTAGISSQELPFYLLTCGHFYTGEEYSVERDNHPGYLLISTVSGSGYLRHYGKNFTVKPGQVFIVYCNEYHYYKNLDQWEIKWFRYDGSASGSFYRQIYPDSFKVLTPMDSAAINDAIDTVMNISNHPDAAADIKLSAQISNILAQLSLAEQDISVSQAQSTGKYIAEKAIHFMNREYKNAVTTDDLCKHLHISCFHFTRTFKKHTGMSPHSYLTKIRINHAKELLLRTTLPVNEIANHTGFENVNSFIRNFKLFTGMTPQTFRKNWPE